MSFKKQLVDLLRQAHAEEQAFAAQLTEAERDAFGAAGRWAVKDVLAHVAEWNHRTARRLVDARSGQAPSPEEDIDGTNVAIFRQHSRLSWNEAEDLLRESYQALVAEIEATPEADLLDPGRFPSREGRPLWRDTIGNGFTHALLHLADLYVARGQRAQASKVVEASAVQLLALDDSPEWQGACLYNLACYHALAGEHGQAVERLGQALDLYPDLVAWSKQDSDLDSLRGLAAFEALYGAR